MIELHTVVVARNAGNLFGVFKILEKNSRQPFFIEDAGLVFSADKKREIRIFKEIIFGF